MLGNKVNLEIRNFRISHPPRGKLMSSISLLLMRKKEIVLLKENKNIKMIMMKSLTGRLHSKSINIINEFLF